MRMRLSPLLPIEEQLTRRLLPDANDRLQDVCVRAGSGWKGLLAGIQQDGGADGQARAKEPRRPSTAEGRRDDPTAVLAACRDDIIALWEDPVVRAVLKRRGVRLQDMPGFFLNDAARIATMGYDPTDEDIVRARLRTLGVEEHRFTMESGALPGSEWYIYDVGGSRNNRPMWIPYFDDIQAIIFLAPLAFNLMLEEDTKVNRLEDSIMLWKEICQNPLLAKTTLILFLNKMDILQATLAAGIRVNKYVPSYGDQPNDVQHVTKYFRDKFRGYHKRLSPQARSFYWHETSVVDTRSTAAILVGVREGILRAHLQSVNVI
ncbi:guanine nucleotide binding protein, alpha subunit [Fomitopsis serialis]|uniref:guanine nucleotide binding protein, alpha subunit n=1 Tax=Fomitopsis serialis TaxID=139415 RepID=UPI002008E289|nr:guanine nucleotide binding protein, alpha subunit [Neoantrodia serialis]KAH9913707.1 guanine nucleotide binding protein, alpha subunit [Neoantrodia serialis]